MTTRCRPGDIAVVIAAANRSNIGKIVTVVKPHDGTGDILLEGDEPQWLITCSAPILWGDPSDPGGRRIVRTVGPALDSQLQPIRPRRNGCEGSEGAADATQVGKYDRPRDRAALFVGGED